MATYVFGGNTVQPTYVSYKSYKALTEDLILAWPSSFQDALDVTAATMDITTIPAGINIVLPAANQVGVGMELHIANRGAETFNVNDKDGGLIVAIEEGDSYKIYLTDNSTTAGNWENIQDGAGTSTAQAQELAGLGLIALPPVGAETLDTLNVEKPVNEANLDFTVSEADRAQFYVATSEIIITMPTGLVNGLFFDVVNNSFGAVTVVGFGGALIDGLPSVFLLAGQTATFVTDSSNWYILGNLSTAISPAVIRTVDVPIGVTNIILTPGQTRGVDVIIFRGTPSAPITAYMPVQDGLWTFHNLGNAQPITVQFGGPGFPVGTPYVLEGNERKIIYGSQANATLVSAAPHAPKVGVFEGGTGADNQVGAFDNLSPTTSLGDTIYHDGTNNVRLPIGTNGQGLIVMGGIPAWAPVSGGTVTSVAVTSSDLTVGGSPITSSGTITLVLNTVTIAKGGTGQTTKTLAFNALSPNSTLGDMTYFDGTNNIRLAIGAVGEQLTVAGGIPTWAAASAGGTVTSVAVTSSDLTVGGSPITSSGTITLSLNTVSIAKGGTGQITALAAFNALSPLTTSGDVLYYSAGNNVRLPVGANGAALTLVAGLPAWVAPIVYVSSVAVTSSDITVGGSPITTSGTITLTLNTVSIAKGGTGQTTATAAFNALSPNSALGDVTYFDGTNNVRLAIGTAGQQITVVGGVPAWSSGGTGTVTSIAVTSSDLTVGGSPITTSGTITLTLNTVSIAKGGTGQTTALAAFNALSPLTTNGDVLYYSTGNNVRLAVGTSGQVLTIAAGLPSWATPIVYVSSVAVTSTDITVGGSPITTSGTITLTLNTVSIAKGGTGQVTKTLAFNALSPTTTLGDIIYSDGTNNIRLPIGTTGQQLTVAAGIPSWSSGVTGTVTSVAVTSSDITVGGSPITTSGTITLVLNTVTIAKGGTGQTTALAAFNALSPLTTTGDLLYFTAGNNTRLPVGTNGQALVLVAGAPAWTTLTGTVSSVAVTSSDITVGGSPITTSGTITLTLNTVSIAKGGTGQVTATAAFNALSPATTAGDVIYFNGTNNIRLAIGTTGQQLTVVAGVPAWSSGGTGTVTSIAVTSGDLTVGGSPITTTGTITLALNTVPITLGGTGQITKTLGFNALSPLTATGDIIYFNGTDNIRLAIGTVGQQLTVAGGIPSWSSGGTGTVTSVNVTSADLTVGGSPITSSGTITLALNTVPITLGGTGQITKAAAFNALSPLTTTGDLIYFTGGSNTRLGVGTNGQVLTLVAGAPAWSAASTGTVTSVAVTSSDLTVGGSPITSSGTITLALNTVPITLGGTGQITKTLGFNALSPLTTTGDIIIFNTNNIRLAAGTAGQVLTMASGLPSWATPTSGTVTSVNVTSSDITVGGSPITTTGTITLVLNTVTIAKGGTGQTTATAAFNALSPLTTNGDIIIYNAGNVRLATGTNGQVLTIASGIPSWAAAVVYVSSVAVTSSDLTVGGSPITTSGTITLTLNTVPTTKGGTGLTTYAVGDIPFYSSGSAFNKLAIAANQLIISSNGTAPIWSTRTSLGIAFATSLAGAATYGVTGALTGSTTISTTAVQANSLIMVQPVGDTAGLLGARGYTLGYGSIVAGTSFQLIVNLSGSNNVTVNWLIVNPITT